MSWEVALRLGRVSNLPTVWTNTLAGVVLAGGAAGGARVPVLLLAMSLFYIAGMYLNDAFDAKIDAAERPERPIPSGQVALATVMTAGFAMLALGVALLAWAGLGMAGGTGVLPPAAGLALAAAIVVYDLHHKNNPVSPLLMGVCRMLVYVAAGVSIAVPLPPPVIVGAVLLLCYLIGLTYVAKQETLGRVRNLWPLAFLAVPVVYGAARGVADFNPLAIVLLAGFIAWIVVAIRFVVRGGPGDIPRAVLSLIAGICLLDAMLIALAGAPGVALVAVAGFALTLLFQRFVPGT